MDDHRYPLEPPMGAGWTNVRERAELDAERFRRELLLWRHVAADRGWRCDGYGYADRGAADHAPLRRVYTAQRTCARAQDLVVRCGGCCTPLRSMTSAGEIEIGRLWPSRWRRKPREKWVPLCCLDRRVPVRARRPSALWNITAFRRSPRE